MRSNTFPGITQQRSTIWKKLAPQSPRKLTMKWQMIERFRIGGKGSRHLGRGQLLVWIVVWDFCCLSIYKGKMKVENARIQWKCPYHRVKLGFGGNLSRQEVNQYQGSSTMWICLQFMNLALRSARTQFQSKLYWPKKRITHSKLRTLIYLLSY